MKNILTKTSLLAFCLVPTLAMAHEYKAGDLVINHPWTRATAPKASAAAGYLSITNTGKTVDVLTAATMDGAGHTMLHQTEMKDGIAKMNHLEKGIAIGAGQTVKLEPGSYHIMAMQLKDGYKPGQSISGTLTFEHAGTVPVSFKVEALGAQAPQKAEDHSAHGHH
ncbi:MAG: copper chaperone PCu(A)C [Blastochloris viridis]|uniref:Copper chaperone PCu(A)C n=1 Tax=Blastochloris viridis TaxID=1079 RepID=A0A6N4QXF0_BLAVI|nr:MAG: copper chaperone PCu(A)C [Blastochloris viridis]